MNHRSVLLPVLAFAGALMLPAAAEAKSYFSAETPIKGRYIVVLKDDVASLRSEREQAQKDARSGKAGLGRASVAPSVAEVTEDLAFEFRLNVTESYTDVLRGFAMSADEATIKALMQDERVAYIEEDGVVSINATQTNAPWGLDRIDQRSLPLNGRYEYATTAANVNVYVIDTGILTSHTQFGGRAYAGYSAINDGRGSSDCNGHGTHVAGTVGASTYGVAKGSRLHAVRVLDCQGYGSNSGIIAGMDWVARNHRKPAVANMSLGGGASTATDQAVTRLRNAGVTVVVAAGNENQNACNVSPARANDAITVGSTASNDSRSSFSNWGSCVNIFAPGSNIASTWHTSNTATNTISGTSMASPHVAGAAALYLAANPSATPAQVASALISASTPNKVTSPGAGSPNRLLYTVFSGGGQPNPDPDPNPPGGGYDHTVQGSLPGTSYYVTHPQPYQYVSTNGQIRLRLRGPSNADFELFLHRWNGYNWQRVAASQLPGSNEQIQFNATPGYYLIEVYSYRGGGSFLLDYTFPR